MLKKNKGICTSKKLFATGEEVKIELIEKYPCENLKELGKREGYYIINFECVNERIAGRTKQERNKQYYEDFKEDIDKYRKQWYQDNKEHCKERSKQWYEDNRDHILEYQKQWYEDNRDRLNAHRSEKIQCECGCTVRRSHISEHRKTLKHNKYVGSL